MFYGCKNLNYLDVSSLDTTNVTNMVNIFGSCSNLVSLDLTGFNTSKVKNTDSMFNNCSSLVEIKISSLWDMSNVTVSSYMFSRC